LKICLTIKYYRFLVLILPPAEQTIPELVNNLRRSDDVRTGRVHDRAGLVDVPLSASPQTLHSLATFFAADNKTRQELGKMVCNLINVHKYSLR